MSASVYTSFLIQADNTHRAHAHRVGDQPERGVIGSVAIDHDDRTVIQASDPQALRVLAAALIEAADMADALPAEVVTS